MFAFVTTLRHPDNSTDYDRIERLLFETLASVCRQSASEYIVFVVGNVAPSFDLPDRVIFIKVDFPAPARVAGAHASREEFVFDKGAKVGAALAAAREFVPESIMLFDADDFVSRDIVQFVADRAREQVWVVSKGYIYSSRRRSFRTVNDFNRVCGTSFIVPYSVYQVPENITAASSKAEILAAYGETLPNIMGAHRDADLWFSKRGVKLMHLPFRAAVWNVDNGENHSRTTLRGVARPLTKTVADQFGILAPILSPKQLIVSFGPVRIFESVGDLFGKAQRWLARRFLVRLFRAIWQFPRANNAKILKNRLLNIVAASELVGWRRPGLLGALGLSIAADAVIAPGSTFEAGPVHIGRRSRINRGCHFEPGSSGITVGDDVVVGAQVVLSATGHNIGPHSKRAFGPTSAPITIEDGCWIGAHVTILPGVTVRQGCIVGAGAVVASSTQADGVYRGVPARRTRELPADGELPPGFKYPTV